MNKNLTAAQRRRQEQRSEIQHEILAAARNLVNERGPQALTMRAVASSVGYSPGALYEYFQSKNDILNALYFEGAEGLDGRTRQVIAAAGPNATVLDRIGFAGRAYRTYALEHPDLYHLIFSVHQPTDKFPDRDGLPDDGSFNSLIELLQKAKELGQIVDGDPAEMAAALWAFVHGFVMLEITGRLPAEPAGLTDQMFETGLRMLGYGMAITNDSDALDVQT